MKTNPKNLVHSYKYFFILNTAEHEISTAHKNLLFFCLPHLDVSILLINDKMPTIVGILTFMSIINSFLVGKHKESFIAIALI